MMLSQPLSHTTALLKIIHWLSVAYKINFTLLCLRFQGSKDPQSLLYLLLRIHFCTFSQDFIPSRNVFLLTIPLFKCSGHIQINFHMIFLSISAHDLSLFLWILFVLICKYYVDIYSHTADRYYLFHECWTYFPNRIINFWRPYLKLLNLSQQF